MDSKLYQQTPPEIDLERGRKTSSGACGFQLLIFIPIQVNSRFQRAYDDLIKEAGNDYIADIQMKESWWYGYVGTVHCTYLKATVYPVAK